MLNQINNPLLTRYVSNSPLLPLLLFLLLSLAPLSLLLLVHAALITRPVFFYIAGAEYIGWGLCLTKINGVGGAQVQPCILLADFIWLRANFIRPRIYGGMYLNHLGGCPRIGI